MAEASRVRESTSTIEDEIRRKIRAEAELRADTRVQAEKVLEHAKRESPVESGAYAAAWHIEDRPPTPEGLPALSVINRNWKAHFVEFGTGEPGPTPAHNVAAKTAAYFGGTAG